MTEQEWLKCASAEPMLNQFVQAKASDCKLRHYFLQAKASGRKLRLFACACCRRFGPHMKELRGWNAVVVGERYADGKASPTELADAQAAWGPGDLRILAALGWSTVEGSAWLAACWTAFDVRSALTILLLTGGKGPLTFWKSITRHFRRDLARTLQVEQAAQANLLRDIFANPFRPVSIDPAWLTPTVTNIASAAYEERALPSGELDPARLAVLADALEEAGADTILLDHLRGPGPHVRGCWAVDCLTGRE
jgi:hypothetical protein